ncbi:MAG: hypothetical protein ACFFDQ_07020 [Candidatus Thorarchaeota archaeon]
MGLDETLETVKKLLIVLILLFVVIFCFLLLLDWFRITDYIPAIGEGGLGFFSDFFGIN